MHQELVKIKNLTIAYENQIILKNVNWSIKKGEFWALIGENGSGKSTLAKLIAGVENNAKIINGSIIKNGKIIYLPQQIKTDHIPAIKVKELIKLYNISYELIKYFDLEPHLNKQIKSLSGGLYQSLFLALMFSFDADIYILDEPNTNLDIEKEEKLYALLNKKVKEGKTIILITHEIGFVEKHIKHVACIHKGEEGLEYHCSIDKFIEHMHTHKLKETELVHKHV